jgi:regulatory protein
MAQSIRGASASGPDGESGPDAPLRGAAAAAGTPASGRKRRNTRKEPPPELDREADPYEVARSIVLRQLTSSPKSRSQLAAKLAERNVPAEVAEQVLDRYEEVHLVDDAEFARMWVRSRSRTRSLARSALKRELADKGITGETAEAALAERSDEDERAAARLLVERKLRQGMDLSDRAERDRQTRRLVSMLARKGYPSGMAFGVVRDVLDSQPADGSWAPDDFAGPGPGE